MNKKLRNRILYVTVAVLWGIAIYRTVKNYQAEEEQQATQQMVGTPVFSPMTFNKDTFILDLPARDPFLGSSWTPVRVPETNGSQQPKSEPKKEITVPVERSWPDIQYLGFVKNRDRNSTLSLVKIDGKLVQLSKGENYEGILIRQVYADSILLVYENTSKTIRK